jgi:hypothetical protein
MLKGDTFMRILLPLLVVTTSFLVYGCDGGSVPGNATLGFALNSATDRIETAIRTTGEAGRGITVQAGTEAYIAIQAAKVAYDDSLNKSVDQLDATVTRKLQEIDSMVNDLESGVDSKIATVTSQAQQIANTLPFANTTPQLTTFSPRFCARLPNAGQLELEFKGNFMFAHQNDFKPSLQVGDKSYPSAENTTQSLKFLVTPVTDAADNKTTLMKIKLSVPYEEKNLLVFKKRKVGTFNLLLGTLPTSPGKIVLSRKNVTQTREPPQHIVTQTWAQHSSNDDLKDVIYPGPSQPGWTIIDDSVRFVVEWSQGDENDQWSKTFVRANPSVVYRVTTIHHRIGTSGKVNFHFEYDIQRSKPVEEWQPETIDLTWGQSRAFPAEPNGWKVTFDSFDGQHREFVGPALTRFLQVRVEGANVVLSVPEARDLTLLGYQARGFLVQSVGLPVDATTNE